MAMCLEAESFPAPEQRKGQRVEFQRRAWCEHHDLTLYLLIGNLSYGGMFIHTSTPFRAGELLRVTIAETPRIVVDVQIVRCAQNARHGGVGCRLISFVQGAERYAGLLADLLDSAS